MAKATVNEATETKAEAVKMVTIKLPLTRTEKDDVFVAVNGKTYLIKRGVEVQVPDFVVEVLQHKEQMLGEAMAYEEQAAAPLAEMDKM